MCFILLPMRHMTTTVTRENLSQVKLDLDTYVQAKDTYIVNIEVINIPHQQSQDVHSQREERRKKLLSLR